MISKRNTGLVYLDTVHGAVLETGHVADDRLDFGGGDVLATPPERVAGAVLEVEVAEFVHFQDVARKEGGVAAPENVARHFLFGGVGVGVAVKVAHGVVLDDHADEHAGLAGLAADAQAVLAADRLAVLVDADDADGVHGGRDHRNEADGADDAFEIDCKAEMENHERERAASAKKNNEPPTDVGDALGGAVELGDERDIEALHEFLPDLWPHSVSVHHAQLVRLLFRTFRCGQQVPANLADVNRHLNCWMPRHAGCSQLVVQP